MISRVEMAKWHPDEFDDRGNKMILNASLKNNNKEMKETNRNIKKWKRQNWA